MQRANNIDDDDDDEYRATPKYRNDIIERLSRDRISITDPTLIWLLRMIEPVQWYYALQEPSLDTVLLQKLLDVQNARFENEMKAKLKVLQKNKKLF